MTKRSLLFAASLSIMLGIVSLLAFRTPAAPAADGVVFSQLTLAEAQARAKAEQKLVFVKLYATWCGHCKRMDATSLADPTVGELYNKHFVSLALNGEAEGAELMKAHKIKGFPALLYFDTEGNLLTKELGYQGAKDLKTIAEDLLGHK